MEQLHKRFPDGQVKELIERYLKKLTLTHYENIKLRIYPLNNTICEIRFWCNDKLIDVQKAKNSDLNVVHF